MNGTTLDVTFGTGFQTIGLHVEGFTGAGTYQTDATGAIMIGVQAGDTNDPGSANTVQNAAGTGNDGKGNDVPYPARSYPCTIAVQTNLSGVTRVAGGSVPFGIAFDVTCPTMGAVASFPLDVQASPSTYHASVARCLVCGLCIPAERRLAAIQDREARHRRAPTTIRQRSATQSAAQRSQPSPGAPPANAAGDGRSTSARRRSRTRGSKGAARGW